MSEDTITKYNEFYTHYSIEDFEKLLNLQQRIDKALNVAFEYAQIDGSHHKMWVIDQMIRNLLGDDYKKWIEKYMFGEKEPVEAIQSEDYYNWDIGIAP